jgi:hypothetical protein
LNLRFGLDSNDYFINFFNLPVSGNDSPLFRIRQIGKVDKTNDLWVKFGIGYQTELGPEVFKVRPIHYLNIDRLSCGIDYSGFGPDGLVVPAQQFEIAYIALGPGSDQQTILVDRKIRTSCPYQDGEEEYHELSYTFFHRFIF